METPGRSFSLGLCKGTPFFYQASAIGFAERVIFHNHVAWFQPANAKYLPVIGPQQTAPRFVPVGCMPRFGVLCTTKRYSIGLKTCCRLLTRTQPPRRNFLGRTSAVIQIGHQMPYPDSMPKASTIRLGSKTLGDEVKAFVNSLPALSTIAGAKKNPLGQNTDN